MNYWTAKSVDFANQRNYLDELYKVYPIIPNERRELNDCAMWKIKTYYDSGNNKELVKSLLDLEIFPIKDSYVAYLRKDCTAIDRNPETINRIAGNLRQLGFEEIMEKCAQPKETNRQIGPMFKSWVDKGTLGAPIYRDSSIFRNSVGNAIYNGSDEEMKIFCNKHLGYDRDKGIDFVARFNNKYVIGESKFLTDFGGHQNAQFDDALSTVNSFFKSDDGRPVIPICIMDGVLYIKNRGKMYKHLENHSEHIIISALILREFLYSL